MSSITDQNDVEYIKNLIGTNSFLDNIINQIQYPKNPDIAPFYLDYLEDSIVADEESCSYIEVIQEFVEQNIPTSFKILGVGSSRIALGYNNLVIKIWYKSNLQHLDDIYVEEYYTLEDFKFKQKVYYYNDSLLITKKYQLLNENFPTEKVMSIYNVAADEILDLFLNTVKTKMKALGMNTSDISIGNIGYDTELNIPVAFDYGFSVGDSASYLVNNLYTVLYNTPTKPVTITSIAVEKDNTYVFNPTSAFPIRCKAYHIHDDKYFVQALFVHILDTLQDSNIKSTFSECIYRVYEYLYELYDNEDVYYYVSYTGGCFDNYILDEVIGTFHLLKYNASENCSEEVCKVNICLKDSFDLPSNIADAINIVLGRIASEKKTNDLAIKAFISIIKLRFNVVPDVIIEHFLDEYRDDDVECFD